MKMIISLISVCLYFLILSFSNAAYADQVSDHGVQADSEHSSDITDAVDKDMTETMTDIIDIKPLEKTGFDTRIVRYLFYVLCAVVLVVLCFYLIDRFIRKKKRKTVNKEIYLPPDQVALSRLMELEKLENKDEKKFYFHLTAIVREYMKGRFSVDATEMTTEELLPVIPSIPIEKELSSALRNLLISTDPVKFADVSVTEDKMKDDMLFVREFVAVTSSEKDAADNGQEQAYGQTDNN